MDRVFLMTDLEGVAGVVSFADQARPDARYYNHAKKLLTAEVNAAIEGLLDAGVEDVLVCDGHGPGGIWFEDLHSAARLLHGRPINIDQLYATLGEYDAAMMIGQHAMAGTATGNLNHTQNSRQITWIKLNGRAIGETAQFALWAGAAGVPLIFLSGDDAACAEARELVEGIATVSVKRGLGRGCAISLSAPQARERIRGGVQEAVQRHRDRPIAPLTWPGPFVLEKRYFSSDLADAAVRGEAERVDALTVRLRGDDIRKIIYR